MRDKLKNIIIILIVVIVLLITGWLLLNRENIINKELAGEKITSGLYLYNIKDNDNIQKAIVNDNNIYYLTNNEDIYKLYKLNIYTNKSKEIGSIESDICFLEDYYLLCSKGELKTAYDTNFKEVYKSNEEFSIVPYQKSFLIIKDREIYLNNKLIKTFKDDFERLDIIKYYVKDNNTFIEFISYNDVYVYNVKDNSYEKINNDSIQFYDNGIYYSDYDTFVVKDLDNNTSKEYNNFPQNENTSISALKDNSYFYIDKKYLKKYDLEAKKFNVIDYRIDNSIDNMMINDNYLYLIENKEVYVVKIDEIDSKEYNRYEFDNFLNEKNAEKVSELENKYSNNIHILYNLDDIKSTDKWVNDYDEEDEPGQISIALDAIENALSKINSEFFAEFKHGKYDGLRIIIVSTIKPQNNSDVSSVSGQTFLTNNYYNIIITNDGIPYEEVMCHEMMHAIDDNASNNKYDIAGNWYDYNPKNFEYNVKQYSNWDVNNTIYDNKSDAYFVDPYSKTNQYEDRARVFENMCYINDENKIKKYPSLLKKGEYIRDELIKYYPSINNSKVFDSLK